MSIRTYTETAANKKPISISKLIYLFVKRVFDIRKLIFNEIKQNSNKEEKIKKENWNRRHIQFVLFGRYYCKAINPKCENCKLKDICGYKRK